MISHSASRGNECSWRVASIRTTVTTRAFLQACSIGHDTWKLPNAIDSDSLHKIWVWDLRVATRRGPSFNLNPTHRCHRFNKHPTGQHISPISRFERVYIYMGFSHFSLNNLNYRHSDMLTISSGDLLNQP